MLNAMREGAKSGILKFIFFGLMGLATFGLVLTDAGGFFGGGFGRQTIAKIGDIELTLPFFNMIYTRDLNRNNIPPDVARSYGIPQMTLGREINRLTLLQAASKTNLRVGDTHIAKSIRTQLNQVGLDGNDHENLDYVLRQMNMSEAQLIKSTREDIVTSLVNTASLNTGKNMRAAIEALYRYEKEKRVAEIILISPSDVTSDISPVTKDDILAFYNDNQTRFTSPEKRTIRMLYVTTDAISNDIVINNDQIVEFYEENKAQYSQPDQYQFAQSVYDTEEEAQVQKDEFDAGIEPQWFDLDSLPAPLSEALISANKGEIIGPIQTSLGYHILKLKDVKKENYTPLKEVKQSIIQTLRDEEIDEQIYTLADDLDNAIAEGVSLQDLAQQYDLSLKTISGLELANTAHENLPENDGDRFDIVDAAFTIDKEEISPVIELSDGSFVLIEVTNILPAQVKPFENVRAEIRNLLTAQRQQVGVQNKAAKIISAFTQQENSLADLARQNNVSFSQTRAVSRLPQEGVSLSTKEIDLLFSLTPKNDISSLQVGKDIKIIRLSAIEDVTSVPQSGQDIDVLNEKLMADLNNEMQQQFINAWKEELGVEINTALFQQAFLAEPDNNQ